MFILYMRRKGKNDTTYIIALLAIFAALTSFPLNGTGFLSTAIPSPEEEDGLSELAYHFPDQAGEPAILNKTDDSDFSIHKLAHHRFFDLFGYVGPGSASCYTRLQHYSTNYSFDNKSTIQIKLRI